MGIIAQRDMAAIRRIARSSAKDWGLDGRIKLIQNGENIIFRAKGSSENFFILRVTEPKHRSVKMLQEEIDFVHHLAGEGLPVCKFQPHPQDQDLVKTYKDRLTGKTYHVTVNHFAPGSHFNKDKHFNIEFAEKFGRLMSNFHKAALKYPAAQTARYSYLENEHVKNALKYIPKDDDIAQREWQIARKWAENLQKKAENYGLNHTDIHFGNIFVTDKGDITVFDFDDSCRNFYLYDLMIPYGQLHDSKSKNPRKLQDAFLTAYMDGMNLSDKKSLESQLAAFERLRDIEMYAWVYMMGHDTPEKMKKWQKQFKPDQPFL